VQEVVEEAVESVTWSSADVDEPVMDALVGAGEVVL
jgi:hypothetical protein